MLTLKCGYIIFERFFSSNHNRLGGFKILTNNKGVVRHTWQEITISIKLNGNLRVQIGAFELQTPLEHLITFFPTNWYSLLQVTFATKTLPDSLMMFTIPFSTSGWMHRPVK